MTASPTVREDMTVDSRSLAAGCGISHKAAMQLIRDHAETIQENFGSMRFENASKTQASGRHQPKPEKTAHLTEDQATFFVTLCRNTVPVVKFKASLVAAFAAAKRRIASTEPTQEQIERYLSNRYFAHTQPACEYGSEARDGRKRTGWRRPTFTVSRGQEAAAREVAAALLVMQEYLPGFQVQLAEVAK